MPLRPDTCHPGQTHATRNATQTTHTILTTQHSGVIHICATQAIHATQTMHACTHAHTHAHMPVWTNTQHSRHKCATQSIHTCAIQGTHVPLRPHLGYIQASHMHQCTTMSPQTVIALTETVWTPCYSHSHS